MKKIALMGLVLLTSICLFAGTQDTYVLKVKVQVANVRSEPDLNAPVIGQVKMGELFEATNRIESFFEITITDKAGNTVTGYIHSGVVNVISGGEPTEETKPAVRQERKPVAEEQSQVPTYVGDDRPKRLILRVGMTMSNVSLSEAIARRIHQVVPHGIRGRHRIRIRRPQFLHRSRRHLRAGGLQDQRDVRG